MRSLPKWIIHLRNGKTLTDKDSYPHDVNQEEITSVERVEGNKVASIMRSEVLTNFFVKTSASQDLAILGEGTYPVHVEERIVGAFIMPQDSPVRIELIIDPETGNVKLRATRVSKVRKDGL